MAKNIFNSVQYPKVSTNTFDLSHDVKMSFQMGKLYPTLVMDCIPGDRVRLNTETMLRFAPLVSPVMHRVNVTTHFFFVPNRLLWPNWERWITGDLETEAPTAKWSGGEKTIGDYLGLPVQTASGATIEVNALPAAAYRLIWEEYYRDQNLQNDYIPWQSLTDGDNPMVTNYLLTNPFPRAWQHDYFTSSLPFAQKGDAVQLPLFSGAEDVPIVMANNANIPFFEKGPGPVWAPQSGVVTGADGTQQPLGSLSQPNASATSGSRFNPNGSLVANTSDLESGAADINTLRRAFKLQEWLERNARGGTRYIENIMAHFGVQSSDARLNRPEFLGGSYQKMVISEVLSTAETDVPVGQMAGHGISVGSGREFTYYCEEHGWIIGLINVQPVTSYQQGIPRMFSRFDRFDYAWPAFANIGEQEVLNKELYLDYSTRDEETFGYVPRYAEYKYMSSRVAGEMRTSLSHWHLGRIFSNPPSLNDQFIAANPSNRIFAVTTPNSDHIYGHIFNNVRAVRKLPKYGTPTF